MFHSVRLLLLLLVSLAIGLAGGPRVHAMNANPGLTAIVIRSGGAEERIYPDEDGSPATPAPDCAKAAFGAAGRYQHMGREFRVARP